MVCSLSLYEGVELDGELEQVLAQNLGPDGVPSLGVVPERLEEVILVVDGRHGADYTPVPAPWSAWPVAAVSLAVSLRLASLRLRDCQCFSAQERQRVWSDIAGLLQFLQRPSNLACRRLSCSRSRRYSMRSGVWFLCRSYSSRSCLLASTSTGFGSVRCLGFPGVPAAVPFCGGFRAVLSLPFGERLLATRRRGVLSSMKSCWKSILLEYCGGVRQHFGVALYVL